MFAFTVKTFAALVKLNKQKLAHFAKKKGKIYALANITHPLSKHTCIPTVHKPDRLAPKSPQSAEKSSAEIGIHKHILTKKKFF